jgi:dihydroflavonol-4-reductase
LANRRPAGGRIEEGVTMKAFVTGGTGFIGGNLIRKLGERRDDVVALVRTPSKASALSGLGCVLVEGDLNDPEALASGMAGCDAVFHVAAVYKVGIRESERPAMFEANVKGTENVMDAAAAAGVKRIVYVSTIGYYGNTHGRVLDENDRRTPGEWLTAYDETKYLAHEVVADRIRKGAPALIAMPGGVYGPGDQSDLANFIDRVRRGRLPALVFPEASFNFVHVDDAVDGILRVHDKGREGEAYVLGGELADVRTFIGTVARAAGRKPPRITIPGSMVRMAIPFGPLVGKVMGTGPNLRELIKAAEGVTYWAKDDKARRELDYAPRDLDTGLRQTVAALSR